MEPLALAAYLDDYLAVHDVADYPGALNGLQADGRRQVRMVAGAVDACRYTIRRAVELGADMLIVHHGLFWGERAPITGLLYARLEPLIRHGIALYSSHLPLDIHPEVGNNAVLCSSLGWRIAGAFGAVHGAQAGLIAETDATPADVQQLLDERLQTHTRWLEGQAQRIRRVAVMTGSAASFAGEAARSGCDALVTGEGSHHDYLSAEETGIHVFFAGHYATETLGVRALLGHLSSRLSIQGVFIDHPTGL